MTLENEKKSNALLVTSEIAPTHKKITFSTWLMPALSMQAAGKKVKFNIAIKRHYIQCTLLYLTTKTQKFSFSHTQSLFSLLTHEAE